MSTQPQPLIDTSTTPNPKGGPKTESGKAISSKNATTHGLFATHDVIHPGDKPLYAGLADTLRDDLAPEGLLELGLVDQIHRAMWRLRRCGMVEQRLTAELPAGADPMENESTAQRQQSVDRARNQSQRLLQKSIDQLRKLQTERQFRNSYFEPGTDISSLGICDLAFVRRNIDAHLTSDQRRKKLKAAADLDALLGAPLPTPSDSSFCKTPAAGDSDQPAIALRVGRNTPCPCQSGEKFKRCCGKNAPPLLQAA